MTRGTDLNGYPVTDADRGDRLFTAAVADPDVDGRVCEALDTLAEIGYIIERQSGGHYAVSEPAGWDDA